MWRWNLIEFEVLMQGFTEFKVWYWLLMCWNCGAEFIEVRGMVLEFPKFEVWLVEFLEFECWC